MIKKNTPQRHAFRIAIIYAIFGVIWITASDNLILAISSDISTLSELSLYKGWFFIAVTSLLVFSLSFRAFVKQEILAEEVMESEDRYRAVIETTDTGFVVLDEKGIVIQSNEIYAHMAGFSSANEIIGKSVIEWTAPYDMERNSQEISRCLEYGRVRNLNIDYQHMDGLVIPMEINATTIRHKTGNIIVTLCHDITEKKLLEATGKKLEAQLFQAQKMEAVGQLAGGIAHDFNNILGVITGNAFLVSMKMSEGDPQLEMINQINSAAQRATVLVKSLLAFSRNQIIEKQYLDMNEILGSSGNLLRRLIGEDIDLSVIQSETPLYAFVDRLQIEQILMNLTTNARDAMPEGGRLTISAENIELSEEQISEHHLGRRCILLKVEDTGRGIDDSIKEKIFEPFFSTKDVGKGTGLGLSMVFGIVKQHGGYITVNSQVNHGTVFNIFLPSVEIESEQDEIKNFHALPLQGSETILFSEDDIGIRKITSTLLREHGYKVIEASDGEEALRKFEEHGHEINLVIMDVIMPVKSGKQVYDEIRARGFKGETIFMSGYPARMIINKGVISGDLHFMKKPVNPGDLLAKVRELLDPAS